jgi:hypothetical protein
MLLLLAYS